MQKGQGHTLGIGVVFPSGRKGKANPQKRLHNDIKEEKLLELMKITKGGKTHRSVAFSIL